MHESSEVAIFFLDESLHIIEFRFCRICMKPDQESELMVLKWLCEKGLFRTLIAMEEESQISLQNCHPDILSVRKLCFQGKYDDLSGLLRKMLPNESDVLVECVKQELKELLSNVDTESDVSMFVERLSIARESLRPEEKREFEDAITAEDPSRHPILASWSIWKGRYRLFERIAERLAPHFPTPPEANSISIRAGNPLSEIISAYRASHSKNYNSFLYSSSERVYSTPPSSVGSVSSASSMLASGPEKARVCWEYQEESKQPIRAVSFSPNGDYLAIGTNSQSLVVCGVKGALKPLGKSHKLHAGSVYTCAWSRDGEWIATGSNDQTIRLSPLGQLLGESVERSGSRIQLQTGTVRSLTYLDASSLVTGCSGDSTLRVIDPMTSLIKVSFPQEDRGHTTSVDSCEEVVCAASSHGTVWVVDPRAGQTVWKAVGGQSLSAMAAMRFTSIAVGNEAGDLILWDTRSALTPVWKVDGLHAGSIRGLDFSADLKSIATVSFDKSGRITDALSGDLVGCMEGHSDKVVGVAWRSSPYIASCGTDSRVLLWSASSFTN